MTGPVDEPRQADSEAARGTFARRTSLGAATLLGVLCLLVGIAWTTWVGAAGGDGSGQAAADRARALALVAAVCSASSLGGWFIARLGAADPALAVSRSLAAVVLRLLLPLALLGWLSADPERFPEAGRMRDAGAGGLLVAFYLSLLATDILLHIMWGPKGAGRPPRTRRPASESSTAD